MNAVLVANGALAAEVEPLLRHEIARADLVIGVDGGNYHLMRLGILPHVATGDFDSLLPADQERLAAASVRLYPTPDQDFTDLDKAISAALDVFGATRLRVFGATGGRLDHLYSVLSAVIKYGRRTDIRLVDEIGETWLAADSVTIAGDDLPGRTLSLLAFGRVEGITMTGVRWPLDDDTLAPGLRDGTLNEVVATEVTLLVRQGDLLILLHHPPNAGG